MKFTINKVFWSRVLGILLVFLLFQLFSYGQGNIIVNLAPIDGIDLSPDNIFNYQIINNSGGSKKVDILGTVKYRNSSLRFTYSFTTNLTPGINSFSKENVNSPVWNFQQQALRELFFNYRKLPEGTYEYCVSISFKNSSGESPEPLPIEDCIYQKVDDIFLINLIAPDDNAKIDEYYPMFSWVVNYPFASELTYRIRVAKLENGQSNQNAITRNNPVYQDGQVFSTGVTYPLSAKPLEAWQPYVWTVDAYYKGILLGGAETWKFTIVDDSLLSSIPKNISYLDIRKEQGGNLVYAIGKLKIKYMLENLKTDSLSLKLFSKNDNSEIKIPETKIVAHFGDNRYDLDFNDKVQLKNLKMYLLELVNGEGKKYSITFRYVNPDFLN